MQAARVLIIGPDGPGREALAASVVRLGYVAMGTDPVLDAAPVAGDILVADLRDGSREWGDLGDALADDPRPLVLVADRPRRLVRLLSGREGATMMLTGQEGDAGIGVALSLASRLAAAARERMRARPRARLAAL